VISVSTHVLDIERGLPAVGVVVRLCRRGAQLAHGVTDAHGRIADLARELEPGEYELQFGVADYLATHGRAAPFLLNVKVETRLEHGHYHVPLLLSPYACTTYRGS
jgi:5-hydroxyisourate hydrolase